MTSRFDCQDPQDREAGMEAAEAAISAKQCIVLPTDTVYGIGADAFSPQAVATLLAAKGRGRTMPPPVLIPRPETLDGLAVDVPESARAAAQRFWPGALTLILHAQPSLTWDLGETKGTVALRMPDDGAALELLRRTGPLAVSSANRTGHPAATHADAAEDMLGESVAVYLSDGDRGTDALPSTIIDFTAEPPAVVRQGAISLAALREVIPDLLGEGEDAAETVAESDGEAGDSGAEIAESTGKTSGDERS
ncbi:tRNA threonylcarbamoyl adenosine modification protein (Sua5/YciO/YrdC/YwlC family) [Zhihengliuella flava]|uniref:L-threonylcarbamoyladenylate synthase n=1 Tax=Zhihengliuella flava TaxID=1285193 RepID=A0A931D9Z1_9MICC|nr:tRNA threonylcarbamoyl adenosine modification protein (Sua5/YciO/YrdC/YwlC family) [Zhihengliuella flava]